MTGRNELCPCGSGKRYKHCHGAEGVAASIGPSALHLAALAAHQAWSLTRADALYRQALAQDPADVESLHMLGMVQFERRRYAEALEHLWDAAERTRWTDAVLRQNMGLLLAKLLAPDANARQEALVAAYVERRRALRALPVAAGRVSVVLTVRDQAATVARAIASVAAQTHADLELVVVDDGSTDASAAIAERALQGLPFPARLLRRTRRGAAQAANAGAASATGRYVAFLNAGAAFAPDRIERMVAALAREAPLWGFSQVTAAEASASAGLPKGTRMRPRDFLAHDPASCTLLERDVMGPPENLFADRDFFLRLGGYPTVPPDYGWAFAQRAALDVEPVPVAAMLYVAGAGSHTPGPPDGAAARTARVNRALAGAAAAVNEFCPQYPGNRDVLLRAELKAGRGDRLPVEMLRELAVRWRARVPPSALPPTAAATVPAATRQAKAALVVLGMYRSGTSAFARALNLCGAALPDRVAAAKLGLNPKGFWETEAVTDLDVRFMEVLGGDWNRAAFEPPEQGAVVDQFLESAGDVLASEYRDASLILIKDPRICVLARLWDRALRSRGYRPAYVVVVRHPLEVAGSIETQGDMPVAEGLALWLNYMRRVEAFVDAGVADAIHVGYPELLADWRGVVRRVAARLDLPLDADARAAEVDRFLESGMRTHEAVDADLEAQVDGPTAAAIRALYGRMLARCERDAAPAPR